ncbi:MAG: metallophosphoesterase [Sedimentisphaerales bacterium]|nr:metallophosphoesterase [Sedimentisphaerales bacterium]
MGRKILVMAWVMLFLGGATVFGDVGQAFMFAVVGDRTGGERNGYFDNKAVKSLNLLQPEFVVSVGDNIQGYTRDPEVIHKQWDRFDRSIEKLQMPFYWATGNHDITNEVMLDIYKVRYKHTYHHLLHKNVLFLFVNTEDPPLVLPDEVKSELNAEIKGIKKRIKAEGYTNPIIEDLKKYEEKSTNIAGAQISDKQFEYFKDVLEQNKTVRWTFIVMHKRAWKQKNPPKNWLEMEKLLSNRQYTVFAGHEHIHEYAERNDMDYIGLGTVGGGWLFPDTMPGIYDHVLLVTMGKDRPVICNILMNSIYDKASIPITGIKKMSVEDTDVKTIGGRNVKTQ